MQIDYNILITYGGVAKKIEKGDFIFHEGAMPVCFYQVIEGEVKCFLSNHEGKELVLEIFTAGHSFGEPPLFLEKCYPITAQAATTSVIMKISKERLFNILRDYPELSQKLILTLSERIYNRSLAAQIWVSHSPEEKIMQFLMNKMGACSIKERKLVPYTRQQIADFTGLRVETVIRTLMRMNQCDKVKIVDHKLFY